MKKFLKLSAVFVLLLSLLTMGNVALAQSPTEEPTVAPTEEPTVAPTEEPTVAPTEEPTIAPTEEPTIAPTEEPTIAPTEEPTVAPTEEPTIAPTEEPTIAPTEEPTVAPTEEPTVAPTVEPTITSTIVTTVTVQPTVQPVDAAGQIDAQAASSFTTQVNVQNPNGSSQVSITIRWYDAATGNEVLPATSDTIAANGRKTYTAPGTTFKGSAVISSDLPVAAEVQVVGDNGITAGYTGATDGDTTLSIPLILRSVWNTLISAQNIGSSNTDITLAIFDPSGTQVATKTISGVKPGAAAYFDIRNDAEFAGLSNVTIYSGELTSTGSQKIYAVVKQDLPANNTVTTVEAFTPAQKATTFFTPLWTRNMSGDAANGFNANVLVFNPNGTPVQVTGTWTRLGTTTQLDQAIFTIPGKSSQYITSATYPRTANGVAASLRLVGSQPIVVQGGFAYAANGVQGYFGVYQALVAGTGNTALYAPFVSGSWSGSASTGQNTNILVQNMSDTTDTTVTYEYYNQSGTKITTALSTLSLPRGSNAYLTIANNPEVFTFNGAVKLSTNNGVNISAVVIDQGLGGFLGSAGYPKDTLSTYNTLSLP